MFTHTWPFPPPGAGAAFGLEVFAVPLAVFAAAGVGLLLDLKRSPSFDNGFDGDADGAGLGETGAPAFFFERRCLGEAAGVAVLLAATAEEGDGDAAAFLWLRFAGEGDGLGDGDCPWAIEAAAKATKVITSKFLRRISEASETVQPRSTLFALA